MIERHSTVHVFRYGDLPDYVQAWLAGVFGQTPPENAEVEFSRLESGDARTARSASPAAV